MSNSAEAEVESAATDYPETKMTGKFRASFLAFSICGQILARSKIRRLPTVSFGTVYLGSRVSRRLSPVYCTDKLSRPSRGGLRARNQDALRFQEILFDCRKKCFTAKQFHTVGSSDLVATSPSPCGTAMVRSARLRNSTVSGHRGLRECPQI